MLAAGATLWPHEHDKMTAMPALQMRHSSSPLGAFESTPPTWHHVVPKQEPVDRHSPINDSGISPGHSSNTGSSSGDPSPGSPRVTRPIAPSSATPTAVGQNPPRRIVSPGAMSSSSSSETDQFYKEPAEDALRGLQMLVQQGREMGEKESLQCPLCQFVASSREQFNGHLGSHYEHKCTICEFTAQGVDQLRAHLKDAHDQLLSPDTEADADGSLDGDDARTPRVNNQGKVKTFRCKQCDFVTVTKLDFWEHSRGHIKLEKLLTCPKCPFVTEYKHHLEYHLRNHFGSKPFKCDKCVYSCVNKSMLNSHLKSHSNVYQYRCADCNYATKYCHSLKLHLRKYAHKPAMVLNADGSPNPLPIIDVYGTRRGPKMKPTQKEDEAPPTMIPSPGQYQMFQNPFLSAQTMMMPFPYGPVGYNPNFPAFPQADKTQDEASMERMMSFVNNNIGHGAAGGLKDYMAHVIARPDEVERDTEGRKADGAPLDLSKVDEQSPPMAKNRRKGKAFKLELKPAKEDVEEEAPRKIARLEEVQVKEVEKMVYNCSFCDIAFRDIVMYTMHMGYHGYEDPFKCNMCGQLTDDKVAFFLHIARSSHC